MLGWYDPNRLARPAHDPGFPVTCPFCGDEVLEKPITEEAKHVTVFILGRDRNYFYRPHERCYRAAKPSVVGALHEKLLGELPCELTGRTPTVSSSKETKSS